MDNSQVCKRLRKATAALLRKAYGKDLEAILTARSQELWLLGVDSRNKRYIDICGTIDPQLLAAIQARGFFDADAGYKADAQDEVPLQGKRADIFLLNVDHFDDPPARLEPLIVHELAHFLEQIREPPVLEGNDKANAAAILKSLDPRILGLHSEEWALHLAAGGRRLLEKKLTTYKTIREFLEAAVPPGDRQNAPIYTKKGP